MQKETVSLWMDGENEEIDISKYLSEDTDLLGKWRNYHLIRDVLRSGGNGVIYLDIADKVQYALRNEPPLNENKFLLASLPSQTGLFHLPTWWQKMKSWSWTGQLTQVAFAASVALAVIVGVQYYNISSPLRLDQNIAPVVDTLPIGGFASPVSYGVPSADSSLQQVQEQRRRINAMLQDFDLQRRLHAKPLPADEEAETRGASVQKIPQIDEQLGSGVHLQ